MSAIQKSCNVLGSQKALADALNVTPATVNQWVLSIRPIPIERCTAIESATSGVVTRRDLRPNDWWMIWPELITEEYPAPKKLEWEMQIMQGKVA